MLEWRYGDQLDWRLVLIGLTESASQYEARGYTPLRGALGQLRFRRYGMPFSPAPKARISATARACRAVVAARLLEPGSEFDVFRALCSWPTSPAPLLLDDDAQLAEVVGERIVSMLDSDEVTEAYDRDRAEARTAGRLGRRAAGQGRGHRRAGALHRSLDRVRVQWPAAGGRGLSTRRGLRRDRGQPRSWLAARAPAADTPAPLLERFPLGLTTQEVALLMTEGNDTPDRQGAEVALLELVAQGHAIRTPLGDDALWKPLAAPAG